MSIMERQAASLSVSVMREKRSIIPKLRKLPIPTLLVLLSGCERSVLDPAGDIALQQRNLIYTSTGLMLLIIVPVMILIVVFAWHYRSSNREATYDPKFDHSTSLELVIWSVPLLIIIALGAITWSSTHLLDPFRPLDRIAANKPVDRTIPPLRVQVVSLDWKWLFIYPDQGIATVNELVLPVDRQVRFDITSSNMMNTFYAPTLAGMIYAMPGMQSQLHAVLNRPGEYEGYSANYSGAGFSDMRFKLKGVDDDAFGQWVSIVRASNQPLMTANYLQLEKPSEKVPAMHFATVDPDLFRRVVNRCVSPGQLCMQDMMTSGRHTPGAPATAASGTLHHAPARTDRPEGALQKTPGEITPAPNVTKPPAPNPPGPTQPDSPKNRDMSFLNLTAPTPLRLRLGEPVGARG